MRRKFKRGRVPGGLRAEDQIESDNRRWKLVSLDHVFRWGCNHDAKRGTIGGALCFACWLQSHPIGSLEDAPPARGALLCVSCGVVPVEGDDTCLECQWKINDQIESLMSSPKKTDEMQRDRRDHVPRTTCVLTISGASGSVRRGRLGIVMR